MIFSEGDNDDDECLVSIVVFVYDLLIIIIIIIIIIIYTTLRNRLMFPIRDVAGSVIGFGGRVLPSSAARRRIQQTEGEAGSTSRTYFDPPKYINSPTTSGDALMSCLCLSMWLCLDMMRTRMMVVVRMMIIMRW